MGRALCCDKDNVKRGPWSPEEDEKLKAYIQIHGTGGNWISLPKRIGMKRCGKSCRLRWLNYLRPNIKHGGFSQEEDNIISYLFISIGSRWSIIAAQLPGRTDNDIKNYWNTKLKKKLLGTPKHLWNNINNGNSRKTAMALTNSTMERLQLQMQLQCLQNSSSFNNTSALWPLESQPAGEVKVARTGQMPGSLVDGTCSLATPLLGGCIMNCTSMVTARKSPVGSSSEGELDEGGRKVECMKGMNDCKESLFWWCNEFDAKSAEASLNLWDTTTSALQSDGIFQDFGYSL